MRRRPRPGHVQVSPRHPGQPVLAVETAVETEVVSRRRSLVLRVRNRDLLPALGVRPDARITEVVPHVGRDGDETEFHVEADA